MGYDSVVMNADLPHADTVTGNLMRPEMPPVVNSPAVLSSPISTAAVLAMVETRVTKEELQDMKDQINSSFEEIANMINDLSASINYINERLTLFNVKAGHKI